MSERVVEFDELKRRLHLKNQPSQIAKLSLFFGDQAAIAPPVQNTLVRSILHKGSITLIYGKPKSGKSFLATDLALAVADPERSLWMGHRIMQHGPVLYVACEGHGGFWKRLQATGRSMPPQFVLATGRPKLIIDPEGRGFAWMPDPTAVKDAILQVWNQLNEPPIAVVIDTVFRSFGGANVNDSSHMNAYVAAAQEIADLGIAICLVHHETKANGTPAGSVSLIGAADTIINVEKLAGEHLWAVEDAKDDADTPPRKFKLELVERLKDAQGDEVSSCKVMDLGPAEPGNGEARKGRPRKTTDFALELLQTLAKAHPDGKVPVGRWREEVYQHTRPGDSQDAKRMAFRRDRERLINELAVEAENDWVRPTGWQMPEKQTAKWEH